METVKPKPLNSEQTIMYLIDQLCWHSPETSQAKILEHLQNDPVNLSGLVDDLDMLIEWLTELRANAKEGI